MFSEIEGQKYCEIDWRFTQRSILLTHTSGSPVRHGSQDGQLSNMDSNLKPNRIPPRLQYPVPSINFPNFSPKLHTHPPTLTVPQPSDPNRRPSTHRDHSSPHRIAFPNPTSGRACFFKTICGCI